MVRGASLTFPYFPVSVLVVVYQLCFVVYSLSFLPHLLL